MLPSYARITLLVGLAGLVFGATPRHLRAQDTVAAAAAKRDAAAEVAEAAKKLFKIGEYKPAVEIYLQSYEIHPLPGVVWNIARCYEELDNIALAVRYFEESARIDPDAANRAEAQARADKLRKASMGELLLETDPPDGVAVTVDGKNAGWTPLAPLALPKGRHEVILTMDGYTQMTKSVEITPANRSRYRFALEIIPATLRLSAPEPVPGVAVLLDEKPFATIDVPGSLEIVPGGHRVQIKGLEGYEELDRAIAPKPGDSVTLALMPREGGVGVAPAVAAGAVGAAVLAGGAGSSGNLATPGAGGASPAATPGAPATTGAPAVGTPSAGATAPAAPAPSTTARPLASKARPAAAPKSKPKSKRQSWKRDSSYWNLMVGYTLGGVSATFLETSVDEDFADLFKGFESTAPIFLHFGFGWAISQSVTFGVDTSFYVQSGEQSFAEFVGDDESSPDGKVELLATLLSLNPVLTFYPWDDGLYVKAGGGFSQYRLNMDMSAEDEWGTTQKASETRKSNGFGIVTAVGGAIGFGGSFHLVGELQYSRQWYSDEGLDNTWMFVTMAGIGFY